MPNLHVNDPAQCIGTSLEAWVRTADPQAGVVLTSRNNPGEHSADGGGRVQPDRHPQHRRTRDAGGRWTRRVLWRDLHRAHDDNNWHHIVARRVQRLAGTYNYDLYIDGVAQGINNLAGGIGSAHVGTNGQYWTVGNGLAWPTAGAAFNGQIDNVALYCGLMSVAQIGVHYTNGAPPPCDPIDFNADGLFPDTADIDDFLSVFSGGPCSTGTCRDIDFNNDALFPDTTDIDDFLRVFSGGPC